MSYCAQGDLETRFGQELLIDLTDEANEGVVNETAVSDAIQNATAEMDSYLAVRYTLPLPSVPQVLRDKAMDIAMYRLFNLRRDGDIEDVRQRYNDAVKWLERVRDEKAEIHGLEERSTDESVVVINSQSGIPWGQFG